MFCIDFVFILYFEHFKPKSQDFELKRPGIQSLRLYDVIGAEESQYVEVFRRRWPHRCFFARRALILRFSVALSFSFFILVSPTSLTTWGLPRMVIYVNRYPDLALSADLSALSFLTSTTSLSTLKHLPPPSLIFLSISYLSSGPQTK